MKGLSNCVMRFCKGQRGEAFLTQLLQIYEETNKERRRRKDVIKNEQAPMKEKPIYEGKTNL